MQKPNTITQDKIVNDLVPGLKRNEEKPMLSLVPPEVIEVLARVYMYGLTKYARESWKQFSVQEARDVLVDAGMRHRDAYRSGEMIDPDSGLYHLAQSAWNDLTLLYHEIKAEEKTHGSR